MRLGLFFPQLLSTNQIAMHMKRITTIASIWMLWCLAVISCSGGKKGDITGRYEGIGEFELFDFYIKKDGTGYEVADFDDVDVTVETPFRWTLNGNSLHVVFDPDEAMITGDENDESVQALVFALFLGYSEPRTYTVDREVDPMEIHCNDEGPSYRKE